MFKTALISHVTLATTFNENEFPRKLTFGTQIPKMDWGYRKPSTDPYFLHTGKEVCLSITKLYHVRRSEDKRRFLLNEDLFWAKERRPESVASPVWWAFVTSRGVPSHNSESFGEKLETYPSARKNYREKKRSRTFLQHKVMAFLHVCLLLRESGP